MREFQVRERERHSRGLHRTRENVVRKELPESWEGTGYCMRERTARKGGKESGLEERKSGWL